MSFSFLCFGGSVLASSGLFEGMTDCHSHLLPDVDDGVKTERESLSVLSLYEELGIRRLWLTPHVMEDMPNTTSDLRARYDELCSSYAAAGGKIELLLSSENMLDGLFEERLKSNDFLTMGTGGDSLLVETSYFTPPFDFEDKLERVFSQGYYPILAHPERYVYMDDEQYVRLKSRGVRFQLNVGSIAGFYGKSVRRKAEWLLRHGYYDMCGTDVHSLHGARTMLSLRTHCSTRRLKPLFTGQK